MERDKPTYITFILNLHYNHEVHPLLALLLFTVLSPLFLIISIILKFTSGSPVVFSQKRMGKDRKVFTMYKFRTMVPEAEDLKKRYQHLNEASGPVFKIHDDPRYTKFGKFLSHTGLDELPQLINIIKGEMAFVGPRPLPVDEARKVPGKYDTRFSVLPGITSSWVTQGSHSMPFDDWMALDVRYAKSHTSGEDMSIVFRTLLLVIRSLVASLVAGCASSRSISKKST